MNLVHYLSSLDRLDGHALFQAFCWTRNDEESCCIETKMTLRVESMSALTTAAELSATVISMDSENGLCNPHSN